MRWNYLHLPAWPQQPGTQWVAWPFGTLTPWLTTNADKWIHRPVAITAGAAIRSGSR